MVGVRVIAESSSYVRNSVGIDQVAAGWQSADDYEVRKHIASASCAQAKGIGRTALRLWVSLELA